MLMPKYSYKYITDIKYRTFCYVFYKGGGPTYWMRHPKYVKSAMLYDVTITNLCEFENLENLGMWQTGFWTTDFKGLTKIKRFFSAHCSYKFGASKRKLGESSHSDSESGSEEEFEENEETTESDQTKSNAELPETSKHRVYTLDESDKQYKGLSLVEYLLLNNRLEYIHVIWGSNILKSTTF